MAQSFGAIQLRRAGSGFAEVTPLKLNAKLTLDYYVGGAMVALLTIPVRLLGILLRRNHSLEKPRHIVFVKLLGGGSLMMSLPTVLALRKKYPDCQISSLCTHGIRQFAESYGVFDTVVTIDDRHALAMVRSTLAAMIWIARNADTIVDLEVHSRLTTVLCTMTMVRNRIGFVDHHSWWRRRIYTHSIYYNVFNGMFVFYDGIAAMFGITALNLQDVRRHLSELLNRVPMPTSIDGIGPYVVVAPGCSMLGRERQLPNGDWQRVLRELHEGHPYKRVVFLGGADDWELASQLATDPARHLNLCGKVPLIESIRVLQGASAFFGIDSALLHLARLLCPEVVSFWGPTLPETRLRPLPIRELALCRYHRCAPCIHITETPPCLGQNECMRHHQIEAIRGFLKGDQSPRAVEPYFTSVWATFPGRTEPVELHSSIDCN